LTQPPDHVPVARALVTAPAAGVELAVMSGGGSGRLVMAVMVESPKMSQQSALVQPPLPWA